MKKLAHSDDPKKCPKNSKPFRFGEERGYSCCDEKLEGSQHFFELFLGIIVSKETAPRKRTISKYYYCSAKECNTKFPNSVSSILLPQSSYPDYSVYFQTSINISHLE